MAWSIFTDGGGNGAALTWAQDLLKQIGAPLTPGNEQFVYDWEKSEGGGGKFNPLNQGPVPGHPNLTTTGSQFGGGAADFASYGAGLQGAADYLAMPNFRAIKKDLKSNDPVAARNALWNSAWAGSHYGHGSLWADDPIPGKATALPGNSTQTDSVTTKLTQTFLGTILKGLGFDTSNIGEVLERGALIIFGAILILIGVIRLVDTSKVKQTVKKAAEVAAVA